jgi:hypothetical protein
MATPLILPVFWQQDNSVTGGQLVFGPNVVPVVQNSLLEIATQLPWEVDNEVVITSLYNVTIFAEGYGNGPADSELSVAIEWTNPRGDSTKSVELILKGDTDEIQQMNYVILALQGSMIKVTSVFSGGIFTYDFAVAIAILPTVQVR